MEAMVPGLAGRLNFNSTVAKRAVDYCRTLKAKLTNLGISSTYEVVLCLHIAASQEGVTVDLKSMRDASGAKSKSNYSSMLQSLEKILDVSSSISLQEIAVQMGAPHLVKETKNVLDQYENHLAKTYGQSRVQNVDLSKPMYSCAALSTAAKMTGTKIDLSKLVEISRAKKKEVTDLSEEMLKILPKTSDRKGSKKKDLTVLDKIMIAGKDGAGQSQGKEDEIAVRNNQNNQDDDEDDFLEWKRGILQRAVDAGFNEFKKYLTAL